MEKIQKQALQVAKEVVIKFIEVGRISPGNFGENFREIYGQVVSTLVEEPTSVESKEKEGRE